MAITFTTADRTVTFNIGIERSQAREIYWYLEGSDVQADQFETPIEGTLTLNQQTSVYVTVKENATLDNFVLKVKDGSPQGNVVLTSNRVSIKRPRWEITIAMDEATNSVIVNNGQDIEYMVRGFDIVGTVKGRMDIVGTDITSRVFTPPEGIGINPVFHDFTDQNYSTIFNARTTDSDSCDDCFKFKLVLTDTDTNEILAQSRELIYYYPCGA